jgi:hypothetical protein
VLENTKLRILRLKRKKVRTDRKKAARWENFKLKSLLHLIRIEESRTTGYAGHTNGRDSILKFIGQNSRIDTNTRRPTHYCHTLLCITANFPQMYRGRQGSFCTSIKNIRVFGRFDVLNSDVAEGTSLLEC